MNHLVIGLGEVGLAVQKVLKCDGIDLNIVPALPEYDVLDICIGYSEDFIRAVVEYKKLFNPKYVVIHSTVPLGTCEALEANHSPIRGKHPDLYQSILTFVKYLGGPDFEVLAPEYANYGFNISAHKSSRDIEALKLWETTQFGNSIMLEKEIYQYCKNNSLDFETVYTKSFKSYNEGYAAMGLPQFKAAVIEHIEGRIGGHCVLSNCKLLQSPTAKRILKENESL